MKLFLLVTTVLLTASFAVASSGSQPKTLWVVKLKNERPFKKLRAQYAVPTVVDNIIYIGATSHHVYAIDRIHGKKIWRTEVKGPVYGGIAYQDGKLYFGDGKGYVYAMDAAKGNELWRYETGSDVMCTPVVSGDLVYFTTMAGHVLAVDRVTGAKRFQTPRRSSTGEFTIRGSSSPVQWKNLIIAGFSDGSLAAFDMATGLTVWDKRLANLSKPMQDVDTTPLVIGDTVIAGSVDGSLYAVRADTGTTQWLVNLGTPNDVLYQDGTLYVVGHGTLYALNLSTGGTLWKKDLSTQEASAPAKLHELVFTISTNEKGYWLNGTDGQAVYSRFMGRGSFSKPVVTGDTLYILTNKGNFHALQWK